MPDADVFWWTMGGICPDVWFANGDGRHTGQDWSVLDEDNVV